MTLPLSKEKIAAIQARAAQVASKMDVTLIPALCQQALRAIELEAGWDRAFNIGIAKQDEIEKLKSQLTAARNALEEERERCAKIPKKWAEDIARAGNQFDRDGDIYKIASVLQQVATEIERLSHPSVKQ